MTQTDRYRETSEEFLRRARDDLAAGDLIQASEKGWGAAAQAVKSVAARRGWRHQSHRDLYAIVGRLVAESGNRHLGTLFSVASSLHMNFYEHWLRGEMVANGLDLVEELVATLEREFG